MAGKWECLKHFGLETWRKDPLGIPRRRWKYEIKTDLKEMEWEGMNFIPLSWNKANWTGFFRHTNEILGSMECGGFLDGLTEDSTTCN